MKPDVDNNVVTSTMLGGRFPSSKSLYIRNGLITIIIVTAITLVIGRCRQIKTPHIKRRAVIKLPNNVYESMSQSDVDEIVDGTHYKNKSRNKNPVAIVKGMTHHALPAKNPKLEEFQRTESGIRNQRKYGAARANITAAYERGELNLDELRERGELDFSDTSS